MGSIIDNRLVDELPDGPHTARTPNRDRVWHRETTEAADCFYRRVYAEAKAAGAPWLEVIGKISISHGGVPATTGAISTEEAA